MFRRNLIKAIGVAPFLPIRDLFKTPDYTVWEFYQIGKLNSKSYHVIDIVYNSDCNPGRWTIPLTKGEENLHKSKSECEKDMLKYGYTKMICINVKDEDFYNCFYIDYNIVDLNASKLFNPVIRNGYV